MENTPKKKKKIDRSELVERICFVMLGLFILAQLVLLILWAVLSD